MALRLVTPPTPTLVAKPPVPSAGSRRGAVQRAVTSANQHLVDADPGAWRKAFAAAAEIADDHERYLVRKGMVESILGAQGFKPHVLAQMFVACAAELTAALDADPREPVFLNFAGVLFFELGGTKAARNHRRFTSATSILLSSASSSDA